MTRFRLRRIIIWCFKNYGSQSPSRFYNLVRWSRVNKLGWIGRLQNFKIRGGEGVWRKRRREGWRLVSCYRRKREGQ